MVKIGLLAVLALLALPSVASASPTIEVNETEDAPLQPLATECKSTSLDEGCTLRAAVELANEESEVFFEPVTVKVPEGAFEETQTPGEISIASDADVVIEGAGEGLTLISAGKRSRVFEVDEFGVLTLRGVTVSGGDAGDGQGGGVYVGFDAGLLVEESDLRENTAEGGGGGIATAEFAAVSVSHSHVSDDLTDEGGGGGIYADFGTFLGVEHSVLEDDGAAYEGGGIEALLIGEEACGLTAAEAKAKARAEAHGRPAISELEPTAELYIDQSSIENSFALWGGGIFVGQDNNGCILARKGAARLRPNPGAHAAVKGPRATLIGYEEANMLIDQSTIARNEAYGYDQDEESYGGYGGGIYESGDFGDPIINSTIAENYATNDGGGIADAEGSFEALINDTVFSNELEPLEEEEEGGEDARHALAHRSHRGSGHAAKGAARALGHRSPAKAVRPATREDLAEELGANIATEYDEGAEVELRNTIVAETNDEFSNCGGYETFSLVPDAGHNLDYPSTPGLGGGEDSCGLSETDQDLVGVNPDLKPKLEENGGPTKTLALEEDSPAIGAVPLKGDCEEPESGFGPAMRNEEGEVLGPVDQRGEKRPGWTGRECDIGAYELQHVVPPPTVPVTPPATTTTTTTTTTTASVLPFKVSAPLACTSKRSFTIHIQNVKQFHIVSAVVSVNGKAVRTLTGRHLTTGVNLVGLPAGTFTVKIVARQRDGHKLSGQRVYHTCHSKLPGHAYLPL